MNSWIIRSTASNILATSMTGFLGRGISYSTIILLYNVSIVVCNDNEVNPCSLDIVFDNEVNPYSLDIVFIDKILRS